MIEDFESHISEVHRSGDGSIMIEQVDQKLMKKNVGGPKFPEGVEVKLFTEYQGRQELLMSRLVIDRLFGVIPIPKFGERLEKVTKQIVGIAVDLENSRLEKL